MSHLARRIGCAPAVRKHPGAMADHLVRGIDVAKRTCSVEGCDRVHRSRGLCEMHYQRLMTRGTTDPREPARRQKCEVPDCGRLAQAEGRCYQHHAQMPHIKERRNELARQRYNPLRDADRHLWRRYKMTRSEWQMMFDSQDRSCAVCHRTEPSGRRGWHVHHDHHCCPGQNTCGGCVVAILCDRCNIALGLMGDNPDLLDRGAALLRVRWVVTPTGKRGSLATKRDVADMAESRRLHDEAQS